MSANRIGLKHATGYGYARLNPRLVLALAAGFVAGCATSKPPPGPITSAGDSAAALTTRSLRDEGLHRFLADSLGRDPGDTWDFETLAWAAFYLHPSLPLARAQWATARAAAQGAGLRTNPTLTLIPGYNFTRTAGVSPWMPAINFDFLFVTAGKRQLQQAIARSDVEAARLAVFLAAWQVRADLRRALADTAIAAQREAQFRRQTEIERSVLGLLEQRREAGSIAATEVSVARTALLRAEGAAAEAHGQWLNARARVAAALGLPLDALTGVTLPAPPLPAALAPDALAAARREALQSRTDVVVALAKYQSAHAALELELARRTPDLHLGPGYQWDQGDNKWTLAAGFELPLYHRNEAGIAAAAARRDEAAAQFNMVQAQVLAAIDLAASAQQAAQFQLDHARQLQAEARQQQARIEKRLELGAADQLDVQTARLDVATAQTAVVEAGNAAAVAAGQLEDALQLPVPHLAALAPTASAASIPPP